MQPGSVYSLSCPCDGPGAAGPGCGSPLIPEEPDDLLFEVSAVAAMRKKFLVSPTSDKWRCMLAPMSMQTLEGSVVCGHGKRPRKAMSVCVGVGARKWWTCSWRRRGSIGMAIFGNGGSWQTALWSWSASAASSGAPA